jgi:hypothetical protein
MFRFAFVFILVISLFSQCHPQRTMPAIGDWEPGSEPKLVVQTVQTPSPSVWWEAEQPTKTNFPSSDRNPFAPANATEAAMLSNQKWIGVEGKYAQPLFLEYQVQVPTAGAYFFYGRKFWQHGAFRWRWDDQPWQQVDSKVYLMDGVALRQFISANWVSLGKTDLGAGQHTLRIELTELEGAAAFDCFALTQTPFHPRGKLKPNERYTAKLEDGFIFDPDADPFTKSAIDLRGLNEAFAGEHGFIQARGEEFIHAKNQQPVRFWAVNVGMQAIQMDQSQMPGMARFLAKKGVNMVRLHGALWSKDLQAIAPRDLEQLFAYIEALKREGIYTCLSIYFPVWLQFNQGSPIPGYTGQNPFSLLFFNPDFQQIYDNWWKQLLTTANPKTGKLLRDDPAVAMLELVNEDSYFFWTFQPYDGIPAPQMAILEQQFAAWLTRKHGSPKQAYQAWLDAPNPYKAEVRGDTPDRARLGIMSPGELVGNRQSLRARDTARFLADSQQQFFTGAIAHLRKTLGYKGLIYASNWITADARILGPVDKYTNTVGDFIDRHGYFSNPHEGKQAAYAINSEDTYQDQSALLFQSVDQKERYNFDLPIMDLRYNNLPSTITEVNWTSPNRFRADFPLLASAYTSLQGTDGFFFFATENLGWSDSLGKFAIASPVVMGQFPAAALIYRNGLVKPGSNVVDISLNIDDVLNLQGSPVSAPQNLDEFRAQNIPPGQALQSNTAKSIDPLAFLVGKVDLRFSKGNPSARQVDLSKLIDRKAETIRSSTGELLWDYQNGLVTLSAPQAQGVTGFLSKAGEQTLPALKVRADLGYGAVVLVALDQQPLATSRRMLLQVMSEEQNLGWKTTGAPRKTIQSVGSAPLTIRNLAGQVSLLRGDARSLNVTALDFNGYPTQQIGNAAQIKLLPNAFYYLIEKPNTK